MRRTGPVLLLGLLAAAVFSGQAGAHSADITEARYCNVPGDNPHRVFFTITSWHGVIGAENEASRTNPKIDVYDRHDGPDGPGVVKASEAFTKANGFFFKGSFRVSGTDQLRISTKPAAPWGDGQQPKHNSSGTPDTDVVNSAVLNLERCSGRVPRYVRVNGRRYRCTIVGTRRADTLTGRRGRDVICGFGRADTLSGVRGSDIIVGHGGADTILGGGGRDLLVGSGGADELSGNGGRDRLWGSGGEDELVGGSRADWLSGGGRADELFGNGGRDRLLGGGGRDKLAGQGGRDIFRARDGVRDRLLGGAGRDRAQVDCGRDITFQIEVTFRPAC